MPYAISLLYENKDCANILFGNLWCYSITDQYGSENTAQATIRKAMCKLCWPIAELLVRFCRGFHTFNKHKTIINGVTSRRFGSTDRFKRQRVKLIDATFVKRFLSGEKNKRWCKKNFFLIIIIQIFFKWCINRLAGWFAHYSETFKNSLLYVVIIHELAVGLLQILNKSWSYRSEATESNRTITS